MMNKRKFKVKNKLQLAFVNSILSVIPIAILLITRYWLLQNNYAIQQEINRR